MSKVDAMRALREARLSAAPVASTTTKVAKQAAPPKRAAVAAVAESASDTCGHRSMNGRACTRESGHPEKNHRYS